MWVSAPRQFVRIAPAQSERAQSGMPRFPRRYCGEAGEAPREVDPGRWSSATLCHMDVSVRELRNHTARVVAAIESGERVVLTVHGRPVADIVPRRERSERRPSERLMADLAEVSALAKQLGVRSQADDFETGLTTDDM